ncbi:MAG: alkaline phosphatase family protein, partial [Deltaproteobacteria bacterium]|nr:alkaline phosphatase family protein [Deltaproteobacteria bacterium]
MRERPLILIWLDNLGVFYPFIGELELMNITAAFEGGTVVHNLLSTVPSVTEAAEVVLKSGCGLDQLPVLGEVTFDRVTQRYFNLKQADFDKETGTLTLREGAPKLADFVGPALAKRLIPNLGFTTCQIGWKLGQVGNGCVISLESEEAIRLEYTASYDIIPLRIQTLLQAMRDYQADLYLLNISGDSIVHDQGLAGQVAFMKRLDAEFPALIEGLATQAKDFTLMMFSDHGPRPIQGHLKPEEFLADIPGLVFTGEDRDAAIVSNGRGSLYLYVKNPDDITAWGRTTYRQLRDHHGQDFLAAIASQPETAFVVCNRDEGGIAILSAEGETTLSAEAGGFHYQLIWGQDSLDLDAIEGRVISPREMLEKTHDKPFPYPLQWLELLQAPCCGDIMIGVD